MPWQAITDALQSLAIIALSAGLVFVAKAGR